MKEKKDNSGEENQLDVQENGDPVDTEKGPKRILFVVCYVSF